MKESVEKHHNEQGHFEKVSLAGESLWVEVIEGPRMGTMVGRINNRPVSPFHAIKQGDIVRFGWVVRTSAFDGESYGCWEPESE